MIQIIELGPFGSRIERGFIKNLDEMPEGYVIKAQCKWDRSSILLIEPISTNLNQHMSGLKKREIIYAFHDIELSHRVIHQRLNYYNAS